jgi:hypothetical protein
MQIERGVGRILSADGKNTVLVARVRYEITTTDEELVDAGKLRDRSHVHGHSETEGRILAGGTPPAGQSVLLVLEDGRRWPCVLMNGRLVSQGNIT